MTIIDVEVLLLHRFGTYSVPGASNNRVSFSEITYYETPLFRQPNIKKVSKLGKFTMVSKPINLG